MIYIAESAAKNSGIAGSTTLTLGITTSFFYIFIISFLVTASALMRSSNSESTGLIFSRISPATSMKRRSSKTNQLLPLHRPGHPIPCLEEEATPLF